MTAAPDTMPEQSAIEIHDSEDCLFSKGHIATLRQHIESTAAELATLHAATASVQADQRAEVERLRAELAKHQNSEFHPDWSMLQATRASLAEHQQMVAGLQAECEALRKDAERKSDALEKIKDWAAAYPIEVFHEPDLKRAHELLYAVGMSLDSISAYITRNVLAKVREFIEEHDAALSTSTAPSGAEE